MAQTKVKLISDGVIVQGNLHSSHGITTAHIGEGSNLYYTDARVDTRVGNLNTGNLPEGSNLYYTDARADARIAAASTSDLSEGTNLYYTDARADARVALIVDSSPSTLNTLNELAAALGDDPNFAATTATSIGLKAPLASPGFTGIPSFSLNDGTFIKAVNATNNVASTNVWGYGLYEGGSKLAEISLVRDGSSNQMYIGTTTANQTLRIGTANKVTALTINASQNSTFAGNISGVRGFFNSGATNVVATFTSTDGTATLQCADPSGNVEFGASGNNFVVQPAGGVAQLTVGSSSSTFTGTVLFNDHTTHPDQVNSYFGTGNDASIQHNGSHLFIDNGTGSSYLRNTSSGDILLRNSGGGDIQFDNEFAGNILFNTSNVERMRIQSDGSVGIGIDTAPNSNVKLRVVSDHNADWACEIKNTNTAGNTYGLVVNTLAGAGTYNLGCYTHTGNGFFVRNDGKVGIGTGTPDEKLEILNGNFRIKGSSANVIQLSNTSGNTRAQLGNYGNEGDLSLFRSNNVKTVYISSYYDGYINNDTNKFGFGTTTPTTKLHVQGPTGTRNRSTTGNSSVFETSLYWGANGNTTTNVSINTSTVFPPMGSSGFILVEVSASGYGNSGSNGLIFSYITGGYGGHYAAVNQPYHPVTITANTMMAGTCTWYNPSAGIIGITVAPTNSQGITGLMRVKVTTTY